MVKSRRLFLITLVLMGLLLSSQARSSAVAMSTTTTAATTTTAKDTSTVVGDRALKVLASNPVAPDDYAANAITGNRSGEEAGRCGSEGQDLRARHS